MSRNPYEPPMPQGGKTPASDCAYGTLDDLLADLNGESEETEAKVQNENQPV